MRRKWILIWALVLIPFLAVTEWFGDPMRRPSTWLTMGGLAWLHHFEVAPVFRGSDGLVIRGYWLGGQLLSTGGTWFRACDRSGCGTAVWDRSEGPFRFRQRGERDVELIMPYARNVFQRRYLRPVPRPVTVDGEPMWEYAFPIVGGRTLYFIARSNALNGWYTDKD